MLLVTSEPLILDGTPGQLILSQRPTFDLGATTCIESDKQLQVDFGERYGSTHRYMAGTSGVRAMENQPKFPTCLTNFTSNEKRGLDKMLGKRVEQFLEECVEHAKKIAQREGRQLGAQQEKDIRKSWKNWREKRSDVRVGSLRPRDDKGQK